MFFELFTSIFSFVSVFYSEMERTCRTEVLLQPPTNNFLEIMAQPIPNPRVPTPTNTRVADKMVRTNFHFKIDIVGFHDILKKIVFVFFLSKKKP